MRTARSQLTLSFVIVVAYSCQVGTSSAFTTTSRWTLESNRHGKHYQRHSHLSIPGLRMLDSSPGPDIPDDQPEGNTGSPDGPSMSLPTSSSGSPDGPSMSLPTSSSGSPDGPSMSLPTSSSPQQQQPETPPTYVPPPPTPTRNSPPAVRQQRMDPLMASLTRDTSGSSPDQPMQNIPLFGEIPADGTLLLLAPAAVFAVLGFIYSIVIAFNSSDAIVDSVLQAGDSIAQTASTRNNRVYDKNVCRGLCSSQQQDLDGMRNFMESITRSAREGNK